MKLFEYESKSIAQNLGINTPKGGLASTAEEARDIHKRIGGEVVIKAQVLVAGRGKAGGIKFGSKPEETRDRATEILAMTIKGEKVKKVLVEQKLAIALEISARVYVMGHGAIVFAGTPADLMANHAIRREWLEV